MAATRNTLAKRLAIAVRLERQLRSLQDEPMSEKGQAFYRQQLQETATDVDTLIDSILEGGTNKPMYLEKLTARR